MNDIEKEKLIMEISKTCGMPKTIFENDGRSQTALMKIMEYEGRKDIYMTNIFEDKRYVIKCSKCKHVFEYGIEDMRVEIEKDNYGISRIRKDGFVCCPNCNRYYDFGYENGGK